jgi:hypothetical protein
MKVHTLGQIFEALKIAEGHTFFMCDYSLEYGAESS